MRSTWPFISAACSKRRLSFSRSVLLLAACATLAACGTEEPPAVRIAGADPENGRLLIEQFGCGVCHEVPEVRGAKGTVGPPLEHFARRVYVAGKFPNEPEILAQFIRDPQSLAPNTAMPDLGLSDAHARDIAAYLYELR